MSRHAGGMHPARARTVAAILEVLPATASEIRKKTGLNHATVGKVIPIMRGGQQMHVGDWRPHPRKGPSMAVFHPGPGVDVPDTLPRLTRQQIVERYEKRIKGTEKFDQRRARQRSRHWEKKAAAAPKTWLSALMQ